MFAASGMSRRITCYSEPIVAFLKIFEQARQTPGKIAAVSDGVACNYSNFARLLEVFRQYFAQQNLPVDSVAVIDVDSLLDAWVLGLALRSLGVTTFAVRDAEEIAKLGLRNIGCVVTAEAENRPAPRSPSTRLPMALNPRSRHLKLPAMRGPVPDVPATMARPGGHILMTSGTTGTYKKVLRDAAMEALALPLHAEINGITAQSVVYVANFGLWTAGGYRWPLITWSMGGTLSSTKKWTCTVPWPGTT